VPDVLKAVEATEWRGGSLEVLAVAPAFLQGELEIQVPVALCLGLRYRAFRRSWFKGSRCSRVLWVCGSVVLWFCGSVVLWFCVSTVRSWFVFATTCKMLSNASHQRDILGKTNLIPTGLRRAIYTCPNHMTLPANGQCHCHCASVTSAHDNNAKDFEQYLQHK
jgi:hypothetical protein